MLIPSIDLQGGAVVQLVQGERLAIRDDDVSKWVKRFAHFPKVQVIDLDAAMGKGDNLAIVRQIAGELSCRVGGGVRTVARAMDLLAAGARQVIAGSALFKNGKPDVEFAKELSHAVGVDRVIVAVDSRGGQVVIHGWKTPLPLTAVADAEVKLPQPRQEASFKPSSAPKAVAEEEVEVAVDEASVAQAVVPSSIPVVTS